MQQSNKISPIKLISFCLMAFVAGGIATAVYFNFAEGLIGFLIQGVVSGLVLAWLLRKAYPFAKVFMGVAIGLPVGLTLGIFVGLLFYDGYGVPQIIMGTLTGAIIGVYVAKWKGARIMSFICAIGFALGSAGVDIINRTGGMVYETISAQFGNFGWMLVVQSLGGLVQGLSVALGLIALRESTRHVDTL
jgi:hypothetical protein